MIVYLLYKYGRPMDHLVGIFTTEELAWKYADKYGKDWDGADVQTCTVKDKEEGK